MTSSLQPEPWWRHHCNQNLHDVIVANRTIVKSTLRTEPQLRHHFYQNLNYVIIAIRTIMTLTLLTSLHDVIIAARTFMTSLLQTEPVTLTLRTEPQWHHHCNQNHYDVTIANRTSMRSLFLTEPSWRHHWYMNHYDVIIALSVIILYKTNNNADQRMYNLLSYLLFLNIYN